MSLIDNNGQSMRDALIRAMQHADRFDVVTGYFYLSGYEALIEYLTDIKMRVLVGMEIETDLIPLINSESSKDPTLELDGFQTRIHTKGSLALRKNYLDALIGFINDTNTFDDEEKFKRLISFINKLEDGTLEIRKTLLKNHTKMYLIHNKDDHSAGGDSPGTIFVGSSNLTYSGLSGQGEMNSSDRNKLPFLEGTSKFEALWSTANSVEVAGPNTKDAFIKEIRERSYAFRLPKPFEMYMRVMSELFAVQVDEAILTPSKITNGSYWDLEYQLDGIRLGLDRIKKFSGVILADVAGLGKSIIAAAIARNLDMNTVIICPPHMIPEWEDYKEDFGIRGSKIFSSGAIKDVFERYQNPSEPILMILDEAHRYRNEDTTDYQMLHQISRSHADNKVLLLTATPFNNAPKDIFALVKLFQTPGRSTIRTVEKLGLRFRELVGRYSKLRRDMTKGLSKAEIDKEAEEIALEQRLLIEPVVIRRSRLDLKQVTRYRLDLERQKVEFARVVGPLLMEYDLGELSDLYVETLDKITQDVATTGFRGARYRTANYISDKDGFKKLFGEDVNLEDIRVAQDNLAGFMRRLLVTRFESSKEAFKKTLETMIETNQKIENWWTKLGEVPIMKKGQLPDPQDYDEDNELDGSMDDELSREIERLKKNSGLICVPVNLMDEKFHTDILHDISLLKGIHEQWFGSVRNFTDPKTDHLISTIEKMQKENPDRKIVVFSMFADTVNYLGTELKRRGFERVLSYTASNSGRTERLIVKRNFDASLKSSEQLNDYDVLIATDALSEGFNLHRAGVIVNYDIPYNPTRVIQRIGRINRIDRRTFDEIIILNAFPTTIGESETRIKLISTLKIKLINQIVGSDHKTLTSDDDVQSFFKDEYDAADAEAQQASWETEHRNTYESYSANEELMKNVQSLPHRSRVGRSGTNQDVVVAFGKRSNSIVFASVVNGEKVGNIGPEEALGYFKCDPDEEGEVLDADFADTFRRVRDVIFSRDPLAPIAGRRESAIKVLSALSQQLPMSTAYCTDLIRVIKDLDDINEGTLKAIGSADLSNLETLYEYIQVLVPEHVLRISEERANKADESNETILLVEALK
jgi:superfamily II DNA or RNA helicase/HKD family nuclease